MRRLALAMALVLGLAVPAWADFDDGVVAYDRGDYATALREFRPWADKGYPSAQYNLGLMYNNGYGVPQDYAEAVKWFRLAAEQGDAGAQDNLGLMYARGRGVAQNYVLAHMWFALAAAQGNEVAMKNREVAAGLMTPAQVAEAHRLAREWMAKHPAKQ